MIRDAAKQSIHQKGSKAMNQVEAIKAAMKLKGMSQKDVAEKINVSQPTMNRYFTVSNGNVSMETLCKIMSAIGYEVVLQPKNRNGRPVAGSFAINYEAKGGADE